MNPRLRKWSVSAHLAFAAGWVGADVCFLTLAIAGLTTQDVLAMRSAYVAMNSIGWYVIIPFSLASLATGLWLALGTRWGLIQHYWIVAKLVLTLGATGLLLVHTHAMSEAALRARDLSFSTASRLATHLNASSAGGHLNNLQMQLIVASGGGLLVLLAVVALGVFKPIGLTGYGQRKRRARVT